MATGPPKIGMRIRRAMERMRMNQQQLADVLGVSRNTVNAWINDKAYPQNSIGALEHVLGVNLTGEREELPAIIEQNQDDPRVIEIMKMKTITFASKLSLIRFMLGDDEPDDEAGRRPGLAPGRPAPPAAG